MKRAVLCLLAAAACGGSQGAAATSATAITTIDARCTIGVFSLDDVTFVFETESTSILRGMQLLQRVGAPGTSKWTGAAKVRAPGGGVWMIGIADQRLWRVTSVGDLEEVNARLGLGDTRVLSVSERDGTTAIGLEDGLAIVREAGHIERLQGPASQLVVSTGTRVVAARPGSIEVFDLTRGRRDVFEIDGVTWLGLLHDGTTSRFVVRTRDAVYIDEGSTLRGVPTPSNLRDVASGGSRLWMLGTHDLFVFANGLLSRTPIAVPAQARLCTAGNDATWMSAAGTSTLVAASDADDHGWFRSVAPIAERVCGECHRPGGVGELDLSLPASWDTHRTNLIDALVTRTMPPPSTTLSELEREQLLRYLRR